MKIRSLILVILLGTVSSQALAQPYIHTNGKYILGPCGDSLLLRGLNYAPYNWGYNVNSLEIDEVAKTGANVVRMDWYCNNPDPNTDAVYKNYAALDSAISKCTRYKMIAIIEIHDFTCSNDAAGLLNLNTWWIQDNVFTNILQKHKESVIVNYANEALYFNFAADPVAALAAYKSTYQSIITALRNVTGFNFPIMIDGPDCGANSDAFITSSVASDLIQYDPKHNLIFSAHAYWYSFANNDSAQMAAKINAVLAQNIPFVLGEVANLQDDINPCTYTLNYKPLLNFCQLKRVNWLAWSWDNDVCPARQVSSNGNFSSLTSYGSDIVNNPVYGLMTVKEPKSRFLLNGCNTGIDGPDPVTDMVLYPNPASAEITIQAGRNLIGSGFYIIDMTGSTIVSGKIMNETTKVDINQWPEGIYLFKAGKQSHKLFVIHK